MYFLVRIDCGTFHRLFKQFISYYQSINVIDVIVLFFLELKIKRSRISSLRMFRDIFRLKKRFWTKKLISRCRPIP